MKGVFWVFSFSKHALSDQPKYIFSVAILISYTDLTLP